VKGRREAVSFAILCFSPFLTFLLSLPLSEPNEKQQKTTKKTFLRFLSCFFSFSSSSFFVFFFAEVQKKLATNISFFFF